MQSIRARAIFLAAAGAVFLGTAAPIIRAQAQVNPGGAAQLQRFERNLEQIRNETFFQINQDVPPNERAYFDYGAYLTFSYLSLDDNNNDNHGLRQAEVFPWLRYNLDGAHEIFLRGRWGYRDFNDGDSFDGRGDEPIDGDLDRGYYRFDSTRADAAYHGRQSRNGFVFKAGRDLVYWGNGLVLSQVVDGIFLDTNWGDLTLSAIGGVTPIRTVDFDASRPSFDFHTRRGFFGGVLSTRVADTHRPFAYGVVQQDYNDRDETLTVGPVMTHFEYNSYYIGLGSGGAIGNRMVYGLEGAYEGGETLSNSFAVGGPFLTPVPQTKDEIQAWAADARLDYVFPDEHNSRVGGEAIIASGDRDRLATSTTYGGNQPGTKDHAFNGFGLLNTGLAFAPTVSNMLTFRVGGSTFPFHDTGALRRMQLGTDVFIFNRLLGNAPIDEPTISGRDDLFLGWEPDVYMNWAITSDVTLAMRYGVFFPNSDVLTSSRQRQFFFVSLTYAF